MQSNVLCVNIALFIRCDNDDNNRAATATAVATTSLGGGGLSFSRGSSAGLFFFVACARGASHRSGAATQRKKNQTRMQFNYEDEREVLELLTFVDLGCAGSAACITQGAPPEGDASTTILVDDATSYLRAVADELDGIKSTRHAIGVLRNRAVSLIARLAQGMQEPAHQWVLFEYRDMLPACYQNCDASRRVDESTLRNYTTATTTQPGSPSAATMWNSRMSLVGSAENIFSSPSTTSSQNSSPASRGGSDTPESAIYDCLWRVPLSWEMPRGQMHLIFNNAPLYGSLVDGCARLLLHVLAASRTGGAAAGARDIPWPAILLDAAAAAEDGRCRRSYLTVYRRGSGSGSSSGGRPACFLSGVRAYTYAHEFEPFQEESFADVESFEEAMRHGLSCLDVSDEDIAHRHITERARCGKWVAPCVFGDTISDENTGGISPAARLAVASDFISDPEALLPGSMFGLQLYHVLRQYSASRVSTRVYIRSARVYETMLAVMRYHAAVALDEAEGAGVEIIQAVLSSSAPEAPVHYIHWSRLLGYLRARPIGLFHALEHSVPAPSGVAMQTSALCFAAASLSTAYTKARICDTHKSSGLHWNALAAYVIFFQYMCTEMSEATVNAERLNEFIFLGAPHARVADGKRPGCVVRTIFQGETYNTLHPIFEYSMYSGLRHTLGAALKDCLSRFRVLGTVRRAHRDYFDSVMHEDPIAGIARVLDDTRGRERCASLEWAALPMYSRDGALAARMAWSVRLLAHPATLAARFVPYTSPLSLERSCLHRAHRWDFRPLTRDALTGDHVSMSRALRDTVVCVACPYYTDLCWISTMRFDVLYQEDVRIRTSLDCEREIASFWFDGAEKGCLEFVYFDPQYLGPAGKAMAECYQQALNVFEREEVGVELKRRVIGMAMTRNWKCARLWAAMGSKTMQIT